MSVTDDVHCVYLQGIYLDEESFDDNDHGLMDEKEKVRAQAHGYPVTAKPRDRDRQRREWEREREWEWEEVRTSHSIAQETRAMCFTHPWALRSRTF